MWFADDERAFSFIYIFVALLVFVAIVFVGIYITGQHRNQNTSYYPGQNSALYAAIANGQIVEDYTGPVGNGDSHNTYSLENTIFPDVPANYQLIYSGTSTNDNQLVTQDLTALNLGAEADYITSGPMNNVHRDVMAMCSSHKFSFEKTVNDVIYLACRDYSTNWLFIIMPAGELLAEPWYKINSINEFTLSNSLWLQIQSSQINYIH